jgi:hypothetical protein
VVRKGNVQYRYYLFVVFQPLKDGKAAGDFVANDLVAFGGNATLFEVADEFVAHRPQPHLCSAGNPVRFSRCQIPNPDSQARLEFRATPVRCTAPMD